MFKECHTSKKKGMTDQVKETVVSPYTSLLDGLMSTCQFIFIIGCWMGLTHWKDAHLYDVCGWSYLCFLNWLLDGTKT